MRILTTYLPATSGIARVAGFDVMKDSMDVRRNVGYLPESVPLYPEMRVEEYLDYRAKLKNVERKDRKKRIESCLDRCRIQGVRRMLLGALSKGYRQRLGLADAMIADPPILILDEATSGLDPVQRRDTLKLIKELGHDHTILLSSHMLGEVEKICDRIIMIRLGRIGLAKQMEELQVDTVIVIEVRGPAEQVANVLRTTEGVTKVSATTLSDGIIGFQVVTQGGRDLRETLSQRIARNGWPIRKLDLSRRNLEARFYEVLGEDDAAADPFSTSSSEQFSRDPPGSAGSTV